MDTQKKSRKNQLGRWGEEHAAKYLEEKSYEILDRNVRTPYGEIDLVAQNTGGLVFVEVKTRSSGAFGNPEEAVTASKLTHMIESAECFLQDRPDLQQDWQIDVIAIRKIAGQKPEIVHFENVIP
jgi:putative endonuclease